MTSFAEINLEEIKFDCRFYTGYKPCHKHDGCPGCPHYEPRGEQILVIKLGAMGDVLRSKAILPALKKLHPESWIVWVTRRGSEALVRDPLVDEIRVLSVVDLLALEGRRFAKILCLDKDAEAVALSAKLTADRRLGFAPGYCNTASIWNQASIYALRLGLSDDLKFHQNEKTVPEIVAEMVELPYTGERYTLTLSEKARNAARERIDSLNLPSGKPVIGVNTGCGPVFATKAWTREGFREFIFKAAAEDLTVLLLGGPREQEINDWLLSECGELTGKSLFDSGSNNSLETFFAIVEQCDLVLSADSLAMHAAIALNRPLVAWFGPTCHQEVDLFGLGEKIVTDFSCSPCYLKVCPKPVTCMEAMSAEIVFHAVKKLIQTQNA